MNIKHDLVFASESMLYKDEPWGNQNLLDTFGGYIHENLKRMKFTMWEFSLLYEAMKS